MFNLIWYNSWGQATLRCTLGNREPSHAPRSYGGADPNAGGLMCPTQPLTHILALEVEFLLKVVDSGRAGFNVLAQGGAAGDDAAEASQGC